MTRWMISAMAGRTSDDDEDEEGWMAPEAGSDLWDEPEDAALDDDEEGLARARGR